MNSNNHQENNLICIRFLISVLCSHPTGPQIDLARSIGLGVGAGAGSRVPATKMQSMCFPCTIKISLINE